jgi:putative ABC transport system permease protein
VVSFSVRQRERDTAIRRALGASTLDVVRAVLRRELRLILAGLVLGLILSAGESALISTLSLPVPSLGIAGTAGIALLLFVVAAIAIAFPTRDALRVSPMQALRQE